MNRKLLTIVISLVVAIGAAVAVVTWLGSQTTVAVPRHIAFLLAVAAGLGGSFTLAAAYRTAKKYGESPSAAGIIVLAVSALLFSAAVLFVEGTALQVLSVAYALLLAGISGYGLVRS